jgi:nucleoside-triphosphatase
MQRHIILVGAPGSGKTTVVQRTVELLRDRGADVFGFFTGEIRAAGRRVGFSIESLAGERQVMAHVSFARGPTVSRYRVDVDAINAVAVAEMQRALREGGAAVLVLDEIGKMELFSPRFRDAVTQALAGRSRILASAMSKPHPFVDAVKGAPDVEVVAVTPTNRERLPRALADELAPA